MQDSDFERRIWSSEIDGRIWHAWWMERRGPLVAVAAFTQVYLDSGLPLYPNLWWDSEVDHVPGRTVSGLPTPVIDHVVRRLREIVARGGFGAPPVVSGTFPVSSARAVAPAAPRAARRGAR